MSLPSNFNIRVYGLLIKGSQVLITDEIRGGTKMTKFPGGGLEFGEGIVDALTREFEEELEIEVEVKEHFYMNDFLQISAFRKEDQLISIYYKVKQVDALDIPVVNAPFEKMNEENQCFRWLDINSLKATDFTYPIDKIVAEKLRDE